MIGDLLVLEDSDLENFWEGSQENPEKVLEDDFFESFKEWPKKKFKSQKRQDLLVNAYWGLLGSQASVQQVTGAGRILTGVMFR